MLNKNFLYKIYVNILKMKRTNSKINSSSISSNSANTADCKLVKDLIEERKKEGKSVLDFDFKKKRVQILSTAEEIGDNKNAVLYWMNRDCRVQDNWAFLFAQKLALKNKLPLTVLFCLVPKYLNYTLRHYKFLLKGLKEVAQECEQLNIEFHIASGLPPALVSDFVVQNNIGAVVVDFLPLRDTMEWQKSVLDQIPEDVPFIRVDAHNIVPCWVASDKLEYGARTIRPKINNNLKTFLTNFPAVIKHPHGTVKAKTIDWDDLLEQCDADKSVDEVDWAIPGYEAGIRMLESFRDKRLKIFAAKRNDPTEDALSNLSPWLHFGHISAQRCVLVIKQLQSKYTESVNSYCEEVIIRRELSDNFCFYNPKYDSIEGAPNWAQETLKQHSKDKREYVYTRDELEESKTHEDLWNSAQIELVKRGKLHGFMRMYWAKKILEWSESPEKALSYALYFNDRYALDGNDPNGYVGVMWSICGVHDQGWAERNVFGKIRYMNYNGCKRKFDVKAYVARWGGKEYTPEAKKAKIDKSVTKSKGKK